MTLRKSRRPRRGLTLIEILVVVSILGIIASIVGINVLNELNRSQEDTARIQMTNLSEALELYRIRSHRYPSTAEGLAVLGNPPPIMRGVPKDPWGADYVYRYPVSHESRDFEISSRGPDGIAESEDDIRTTD
jgi:general secretion pathway protein G